MKVFLEFLFHYRCDYCERWWTIADIIPLPIIVCPHCAASNDIEGTESSTPIEAVATLFGHTIEPITAGMKMEDLPRYKPTIHIDPDRLDDEDDD